MSLACFFNLGRAQFWDAKQRQPSYIHNYDMRVYFPVAKYFHELKYDGLYLASVQAYIENTPGASVQSLANVELRDLRNHEMRRVRDVADQIQTISQRFTPERWTEFKRDMRYFHETMGRDYFTTLTDHGGNATPVWLTVAHFMFAHASASNALLFVTGLLDPLLILLFAFVAGRTFGWRTAFVCVIVFGATDLYMFGTDWAGATLRNDWMAALGLGVCALKVRRWYLGGALLAYAGMIRAFPGIAVMGLAVPPLWWLYDQRASEADAARFRARARGDAARDWRRRGHRVALVALSSAVLSPSAWVGWAKKAAVLTSGYHVNHVSLSQHHLHRLRDLGDGGGLDPKLPAPGALRAGDRGVRRADAAGRAQPRPAPRGGDRAVPDPGRVLCRQLLLPLRLLAAAPRPRRRQRAPRRAHLGGAAGHVHRRVPGDGRADACRSTSSPSRSA